MPVSTDILRAWRMPRRVLREKLEAGPREDRAIAVVMAACVLIFVAQWPSLSREAFLTQEAAKAQGLPLDSVPTLQALMGSRLLGIVFFLPLILYALAWLSHGVARLVGGKGTAFGARLALFWALLASTPVILFHGLLRGFIGTAPSVTIVGIGVFASFLYLWISMLIEAER